MNPSILLFSFGIALPSFTSYLPPLHTLSGILLLALAVYCVQVIRPLAWLLIGVAMGVYQANQMNEHLLKAEDELTLVRISGWIEGLPEIGEEQTRFRFRVDQTDTHLAAQGLQTPSLDLLQLNWYSAQAIHPDQYWTLEVKLRRPRGFANQGLFDYQSWLIIQGFSATGYVSGNAFPNALKDRMIKIDWWRSQVSEFLRSRFDAPEAALLSAFTVGDGSFISDEVWQLYRDAGIIHLVVISGLHVGIAAGFGFALGAFLGRLPLLYRSRIHFLPWATCGGIVLAAIYAAAAGFSLPTQRALIMIVLFLLARALYLKVSVWLIFSLAVALVLVLDFMALHSLSFWLSFGAVAVLLFFFDGCRRASFWRSLVLVQWALMLGFAVLLLVLTGQFSPLYSLVNLLAVPLTTLWVVPWSLLGLLLFPISEEWAYWPFRIAEFGLMGLDWVLAGFQPFLQWRLSYQPVSSFVVVVGLVCSAILLLPKKTPFRSLAWFGLLPFVFSQAPQIQGLEARLVDVGQGNAMLIRTAQSTLVYDTGPKYSDNFDAGKDLLAPLLTSLSVAQLDRLVVSHDDLDHSGGLVGLLEEWSPHLLESGMPLQAMKEEPQLCYDGVAWESDGVQFRYLYPPAEDLSARSDNDRSCVLLVQYGTHSLLLTGDISTSIEYELLNHPHLPDRVEILVASHHGSNSSTSMRFLTRLSPQWVLISSGYKNRFGHPHPDVMARLQLLNTQVLNTADVGGITLRWDTPTSPVKIATARAEMRFWWQQ